MSRYGDYVRTTMDDISATLDGAIRRPITMTPAEAEAVMRRCGWQERTIRLLMHGEPLPRWPIAVGCLNIKVNWSAK